MADNEGSSSRASSAASLHPTITLPPRSSGENFLIGGLGASPGPMTLVSNFFSENDPDSDCRSFSQLLAGAMVSPAAVSGQRPRFSAAEDRESRGGGGGGGNVDFQFRESRPSGLMISQSPMFTVPPGLSPASLLDSPGFFPPAQGHFGMSHQQALARITAHAAQPHSQMPPSIPDHYMSSDISHSDQRPQPSSFAVDKPADDGYNWRKYGQKQVKGSEYPRSYYKCTHPNCPVKKKVERSLEGQVTEIIYKGQHNHQPPQSNKRAKDTGNSDGNYELGLEGQTVNFNKFKEEESSQATKEQLSGSGDSEELVGDAETGVYERDEDEPELKRRNTEVAVSDPASSHRTVTEPRIIVQTTSEVDLLDDGYRWRKYGQKVVKGNPYPRSYYKCTSPGCGVRKHVERAATDPKAVITTYEGKHNHDVPAARNSSHNPVNNNGSQLKPNNAVADQNGSIRRTDFGNNGQQRIGLLQFKEEHIT